MVRRDPQRLERILLVAILGVNGGGAIMGTNSQDRIVEVQDQLVAKLDEIKVTIQETSKALAVAVSKLEEHDRRLQNLETLYMRDGMR